MIDKQTQDLVWSLLPKKFKEEVKRDYQYALKKRGLSDLQRGAADTLEHFFGKHNLTSDADGEEMLTVSRKRVQEMYAHYDKISNDPNRPKDYIESVYEYADGVTIALDDLFGLKCLPDDGDKLALEPKPAEPKFKVGDKAFYVCSITVKHKCTVMKVKQNEHSGKWEYNVLFDYGKPGLYIPESDLEPYIEPKKREIQGNTGGKLENPQSDQIANCDDQFDNILKDSFRNERRLNIAAMAMQGILSNESKMKMYEYIASTEPHEKLTNIVAHNALRYADTLIAKSEVTRPSRQGQADGFSGVSFSSARTKHQQI